MVREYWFLCSCIHGKREFFFLEMDCDNGRVLNCRKSRIRNIRGKRIGGFDLINVPTVTFREICQKQRCCSEETLWNSNFGMNRLLRKKNQLRVFIFRAYMAFCDWELIYRNFYFLFQLINLKRPRKRMNEYWSPKGYQS